MARRGPAAVVYRCTVSTQSGTWEQPASARCRRRCRCVFCTKGVSLVTPFPSTALSSPNRRDTHAWKWWRDARAARPRYQRDQRHRHRVFRGSAGTKRLAMAVEVISVPLARPWSAAVKVSSLTSTATELPFSYYSLPFCQPQGGGARGLPTPSFTVCSQAPVYHSHPSSRSLSLPLPPSCIPTPHPPPLLPPPGPAFSHHANAGFCSTPSPAPAPSLPPPPPTTHTRTRATLQANSQVVGGGPGRGSAQDGGEHRRAAHG
jgi:hypothetical protein